MNEQTRAPDDAGRASDDPLLQPFRLKHLVLKNRIMSTSHAISYAVDGKPMERYQLYHEEKAKGGIALTMFGGASNVAIDSASVFNQLHVDDDSIIPYFQAFAERIHRHGCALMCQLTHMGRRTSNLAGHWLPTIAPSAIREEMHRSFAKEMDRHDIERVVRAFGAAAWRCQEGGLDGCEVIASGHLIDQFWSPRTNRRTDGFGGSLYNRTRFSRLVFEEMRRRTGGAFLIGLRMIMDENHEAGLGKDDCLEIARLHADEGLVDFLNLVHGRVDTLQGLADYMPGMAAPLAPFLDLAGEFRRAVGLPVFHATRINDIATARHALREGLVDMVGMTRGHIADPHIVEKIARGEEERIRPCVGATYCSTYRQCIHNAATGREATLPHVVPRSTGARKKVVVVGGGPGGLEAARVSAERGHEVALFEATARLGGQVLLAAKASWRRDLVGIADWLAAEVERLGVRVRLNLLAEAADVIDEDPDVVIVATGGLPSTGEVSGEGAVLSVWDVLSGAAKPTGEVLVFDELGKNQALSCADHLAQAGARVELVTPDGMAACEVPKLEQPTYLRRFYEMGVVMTPDRRLARVEPTGNRQRAVLVNALTGAEEEREVDAVVVECGTLPNDGLYHALRPDSRNDGVTDLEALVAGRPQALELNPAGRFALYRVGDCVTSRDIHAAILDSLRLCVTL